MTRSTFGREAMVPQAPAATGSVGQAKGALMVGPPGRKRKTGQSQYRMAMASRRMTEGMDIKDIPTPRLRLRDSRRQKSQTNRKKSKKSS